MWNDDVREPCKIQRDVTSVLNEDFISIWHCTCAHDISKRDGKSEDQWDFSSSFVPEKFRSVSDDGRVGAAYSDGMELERKKKRKKENIETK